MKKQSYTVIYEADPNGGFVASVPALPGCLSQGDSLEETERNITEAIELYIESLQVDHVIPPVEHIWQGRVEVAVQMPEGKLPSLTSGQVLRALKRAGFVELRQKGSHLVLYNEQTKAHAQG